MESSKEKFINFVRFHRSKSNEYIDRMFKNSYAYVQPLFIRYDWTIDVAYVAIKKSFDSTNTGWLEHTLESRLRAYRVSNTFILGKIIWTVWKIVFYDIECVGTLDMNSPFCTRLSFWLMTTSRFAVVSLFFTRA